jgi:FSR family fosmidomycin resistance protein-like MFS transporter
MRVRPDPVALVLLGVGHLVTDINQGALILLLPVVKAELSLTNAATALLVTAATITSSMLQPVFGWLSDHWRLRALLPLGCLLAGVGIGMTALTNAYLGVMAAVVVSGIGIAAYHPEAAKRANAVSGDRRATGMSVYAVGGNLGFAVGTLVITPFLLRFGRSGALGMVPFVVVMSVVLWLALGRIAPQASAARAAARGAFQPMILLLLAVVTIRSWAQFGFVTFLPLWYSAQHRSLADASRVVFFFLLAGAIGTSLGGPLADRFGRKRVVLASMGSMTPLLLGALYAPPWLVWPVLLLAGAATVSSFVVTLVMAQELMPRRTGMAAGLMAGFAIGMGGLGVGALGRFADAFGLEQTLTLVALLPLLGVAGALFLRDSARRAHPVPLSSQH